MYLGFEFLHIPKRWSFLFAGLALGAYVLYLAVRRSEWTAYAAADEPFEQRGHFLKY